MSGPGIDGRYFDIASRMTIEATERTVVATFA